jgi:catechol 2,3-dioxygenase-like lactoylglutathione lyase family enzyme
MFDHIGIQVADVEATVAFYLRVFAPLGMRETKRFEHDGALIVALATGNNPALWFSPAQGAETRELHVAFPAADRAAIDAVHAAALDAGVEVLHAPREWPEYHPGYYAVFLRDPDGHNVEAVTHGAPPAPSA